MDDPQPWEGHPRRLVIYYPPHQPSTRSAYRACDRFRVLAKVHGGPH